jgi:RecA/RadA recombinase
MHIYIIEHLAKELLMAKNIATEISKNLEKFKSKKILLGSDLPDSADLEYVELPSWWKEATNTKGLPFRKIVMIAGDSDSGKTSFSIVSIKAAQDQKVAVLYVETEGKTTKQDFVNWGVDPKNIYIMQESVAEEIYDEVCEFVDQRIKNNPKEKLLIVIDSIGNVISKHDAERSLSTSGQKPGGKGKTNREGLNKLIAKRTQHDIALLIINYTYDNIGSPGKTNAGGKAVNFFSSLTYQTSRKSWIEKTVKGQKVRVGAKVQWKLFKNHIDRSNPGPKVIEFDITSEGFKLIGATDESGEES